MTGLDLGANAGYTKRGIGENHKSYLKFIPFLDSLEGGVCAAVVHCIFIVVYLFVSCFI